MGGEWRRTHNDHGHCIIPCIVWWRSGLEETLVRQRVPVWRFTGQGSGTEGRRPPGHLVYWAADGSDPPLPPLKPDDVFISLPDSAHSNNGNAISNGKELLLRHTAVAQRVAAGCVICWRTAPGAENRIGLRSELLRTGTSTDKGTLWWSLH